MNRFRNISAVSLAACAVTLFISGQNVAYAQKNNKAPEKTATASQASVALKGKNFASIAAGDAKLKAAKDPKDLAAAKKLIGKTAVFSGTVAKVFEPKGLVLINFDKNYKNAITAVVRSKNFSAFPDLKTLEGKKVIVSGKVEEYKGTAEVMLEKMDDIKIVK